MALRNNGRAHEAAVKAQQFSLFAGGDQNRLSEAVVHCPRGRVVCRVIRTPEGRVFIPLGRHRRKLKRGGDVVFNGWEDATPPYWLEPDHVETIRAACRCCAEQWTFTTTQLLEQVEKLPVRRKSIRLPML